MTAFSKTLRFALLASVAWSGGSLSVKADPRDDEIRELRELINQLDQKLRVLERKQELKDEATAESAKKTGVTAADAVGFSLSSSDKAFRFNLKLLAQVDSRVFFNEQRIEGTSTTVSQNTFLLRRVRPIVSGTFGGIYEFNVTPEFGGGDSSNSSPVLQDAWLAAKLTPTFAVKAGKFTSPVALEPGSNRHFIESPFVNVLLPNRDIGIEFLGALGEGLVDYRVGVYNGARNNTATFARDADNAKSVAGRVTVYPAKQSDTALSGLGVGIGGSLGRDKGSAASTLQTPVTNGQQTLLNFGSIAADGRHRRVSPSVFLYTGPASVVGEYAWENQDLVQGSSRFSVKNTAWRVSAGYVLTGEDATAKGVAPRANFRSGGGWGAFEVAGRVSGIEFDDALFSPTKGALANVASGVNATGASAYGLGLNWYLTRNLTVLFNYELTEFDGNTRRPNENAFLSRAQVNF